MREISSKERAELIRKGNELFNKKEIEKAAKIFTAVDYKDGLIRVGDYYYKKGQMIFALKYYNMANYKKRIDEAVQNIISVFKLWVQQDKNE